MDNNPSGKAPRKVRFIPKAPPKREQQLVLPKVEKVENDINEVKAEQLLRRYKETSTMRQKPEKKAAPAQIAFGGGGASGTLKSYGSAKGVLKNEALSSDGDASQMEEKEYKEPYDYSGSYYPTTCPLRMPYSGNPEDLDADEFSDDPARSKYVENDTNAAEKLGLLDKGSMNNMFFLQLPEMLPAIAQPADSEVTGLENKQNSSKGSGNISQKLCKLESLPEGRIGKMLVYKSGAVKLKIGDTLYDVSPGVKCTFAQDAVAINVEKKQFCNLGEVNKRAVATPDIDSILESVLNSE